MATDLTLNWIFQLPVSAGATLVMLVLYHHQDDEGMCQLSQLEIANRSKLDERSVRRHLLALEGGGHIQRSRSSRNKNTQYSIARDRTFCPVKEARQDILSGQEVESR